MADWVDPPYTQLVKGKPWTEDKATAAFENVVALAEGAPGAPIVREGWHPFDADTVGQGVSGVIYDFATDGDVSAVVSPTLPLGYEYMAVWCDIRSNRAGAGTGNPQLLVELSYWANPSNYIDSLEGGDIFTASGLFNNKYSNGYISLSALSEKTYLRSFGYFVSDSTTGNTFAAPSSSAVTRRPVGGLSNIRFRPSTSNNLNFGKIWLLRRRRYISA